MNIHEFQTKEILRKYGVPVPEYFVIDSLENLEDKIQKMGWNSAVIKVQIHAGGRGKAGGVKIAKNRSEIIAKCKELLGIKIINNQTGPKGMIAHHLLISPLVDIQQEYYLGLTINRELGKIILIASPEGGVDIEKIAQEHPEQLCILSLPIEGAFRSYQILYLAKFMGWSGDLAKQSDQLVKSLTKMFIDTDAEMLEINPLIKTNENELIALDAKLVVDENALYRQPLIKSFFDPTQIMENEVTAKKFDLAYVALDGDIGCMVNGAGLAMATMDIIHHFGGRPANFLDVGGSATKEKVAEGFKIILSDKTVKGILVNIFGGIMNCETLALGIVDAAKELEIRVPLVVRMEGTNVEQGKDILSKSGLNILIAHELGEAAKEIVRLSR